MHDVVVANGRNFGGGMIICPEAEPDDGLFDVLTIGDLTKRDLLVTLPKTYRGRHLPHPKAELLRGRRRDGRRGRAAADRARRRAARHDARPLRDRARARCACACRPSALRLGSPGSPGSPAGFFGVAGLRAPQASAPRRAACRQLLLELRDALLELVEAAQLLLHLVEPRPRLVREVHEPRATGHVGELVSAPPRRGPASA